MQLLIKLNSTQNMHLSEFRTSQGWRPYLLLPMLVWVSPFFVVTEWIVLFESLDWRWEGSSIHYVSIEFEFRPSKSWWGQSNWLISSLWIPCIHVGIKSSVYLSSKRMWWNWDDSKRSLFWSHHMWLITGDGHKGSWKAFHLMSLDREGIWALGYVWVNLVLGCYIDLSFGVR